MVINLIFYSMKKKSLLSFICLSLFTVCIQAQNNDFGIWTSIGAEKKINKKLSVGVEGELRTRNNTKTADRWTVGASADYKLTKYLKVGAAYDFLYGNNIEKISYHSNGDYNNWRPSFWSGRHRFNVSVTGDVNVGAWNLSLRERWQYTYRPATTTERYDFDNAWWENTDVGAKAKNVLRSRFQLEYNISHSKFTPYVNVELFNAWNLQKVRYTIGAEQKIRKRHIVGLYYRYQTVSSSDDDDEPNRHILGVNYKLKF